MTASCIILHARGHYRVASPEDSGRADRYAVIDTAGTVLHREASLDDAKARIERLVAAAECMHPTAEVPPVARAWRRPSR